MERQLMASLKKWKENKHRKPLILWGARQTGKTWLMKEFGKICFENAVYISFYNNSRIARIFDEDYDIKRIINALEIELRTTITAENTVLLFDEVQSCPRLIEALKYFCEDASEYAVVAAGSLLGVALHEGISFPVGKVDELRLHPMNFREFLLAMGESRLAEYTDDYRLPQNSEFAQRYRMLLREYFCVGGMPEAVQRYSETRDLNEAREVQLSIVNQYEGDFGKHISANEIPRIRMVWNAIPLQLAKENRKFFFGQMKKGARRTEYEKAIEWLKDAGLIHIVPLVKKPAMPLKSYVDMSAFKIYMVDIGLLGALSELDMDSVLRGNDVFTEFKGALTEQYVLQEIIAGGTYTPYYHAGDKSTYEVDFLIQHGRDIVPIEVKSSDNLRSKSLKYFSEKFQPKISIRFSAAEYRKQDWMENIPLWTVNSGCRDILLSFYL